MSSEPLRAGDPDRLGAYWLASRLGSGGQGVVYEAYDEAANRVAVKVLHAYLPGDHQLRRRFVREVTAAQRVASFCTARVIDHDLTGERPYIVSEFVPGPSMRMAITGPLGADDLHRLAVGMATALAAIHQAGVVHRDLKPENVLLGPDGPRVIDFGIARAVGLSMTSTGELAGTPMYMAPELFAGGRAEPAADVFAWGAMAYFAATGKDAFGAPTTVAVINRLLTASLDLTPVPEAVRDLVASALAKDPGARPTAQELLLHLLGTRHSLSDGARAAAVVRPPGEPAGDPALGTVAEQVYASLPAQEREVVRQVLLRLVDVHDTNESVRRAALGELPDPVAAEPVVAALERAALIERTEDTLSVRQAALLRAWPRLNGWVSGDRDALRRHRRFGEAARHWFESGRHPEDLLRGTALREALAWSAAAPSYLTLNPVEKAFLEASQAQSVRQRRRRRLVVTSLAGLLVVSLAAGGTAWQQSLRGDASERDLAGERARVAARNVALQADSLRRTDPVRAMLLSAAAFSIARVPESKAAVFSSLGQQEFRVFKDPELGNSVRALTRDGRYFVSVGSRITVYDVLSGGRVSSFAGVPAGVRAAAVSDDGHTLALGFDDKLTLWDLRTGKPLGEGPMSGFQTTMALRFSPGGEYVSVFSGSGGPHGALWSVATRKLVRTGAIEYVVGPGDRGIVADGKPETPSLPKGIFGFSPDGRYALVRTARRLELWDIGAGRKAKGTFEANHLYSGDFARFTADGAYLVTTERNNVNSVTTMALWRVRDGAQLLRFTLPFSVLEQPGLSADNRMLTVLDDTGQVTVYDVSRVTGAHQALPAGTGARAMTPDGGFALASIGGQARTLSIPGFTEAGPPIAHGRADPYDSLVESVSPDARTVVTGDSSDLTKPMLVWDRLTRQIRAKVKPPQLGPNPWAPVFSPDGRFAVTAYTEDNDLYGEGSLAVYDTATWQVRKTFRHVYAQAVRFSADSRYLATGDPQGFALLDLTTMKLAQGTNPNHWLTLDATGGLGAAPSGTRSVAIWNTRTWKPTGQLFKVNGDVTNAEFSRDGSVLAVVYGDWLALFDLRTGRQLGDPWPTTVARSAVDVDHAALLAFTRDGEHLRVIGADGTFRELLLDPATALPQVCGRAGRALTAAEWRQYVGADLPYQPVCAQP